MIVKTQKWIRRLHKRSLGRLPGALGLSAGSAAKKRARACVERGRELYNSKAYSAAVDEFRLAVTIDPHNQRALYCLGNACYKVGDGQQALLYWGRCVSVGPATRFADMSRQKTQHVEKERRKRRAALDEFCQ